MARRNNAWDEGALPNLEGRVYLITGSTSGLGYFSAEQLARAGAHVILSGRNVNKLTAARAAIGRRVPGASLESMVIDVTKLSVVRSASASLGSHERLDGVILNAGIVNPPRKRQEIDGHESVLTTNVLGHFALAAGLLPKLAEAGREHGSARIVWLGSMSTLSWRTTEIDPELREGYSKPRAYVQSKFIGQAVAAEADRRLREAGVEVGSVIAHPGYSLSGRSDAIPGVNEVRKIRRFLDNLQTPITQSKDAGAHSQVRALIDPGVESGDLVGPRFVFKGAPKVFRGTSAITKYSSDPVVGKQAWEFCEQATRTEWPFVAARG